MSENVNDRVNKMSECMSAMIQRVIQGMSHDCMRVDDEICDDMRECAMRENKKRGRR